MLWLEPCQINDNHGKVEQMNSAQVWWFMKLILFTKLFAVIEIIRIVMINKAKRIQPFTKPDFLGYSKIPILTILKFVSMIF